MSIDEKAFHAAWEIVGWDTQNPHAEDGQRKFIRAYEAIKVDERSVDMPDNYELAKIAADAVLRYENARGCAVKSSTLEVCKLAIQALRPYLRTTKPVTTQIEGRQSNE